MSNSRIATSTTAVTFNVLAENKKTVTIDTTQPSPMLQPKAPPATPIARDLNFNLSHSTTSDLDFNLSYSASTSMINSKSSSRSPSTNMFSDSKIQQELSKKLSAIADSPITVQDEQSQMAMEDEQPQKSRTPSPMRFQ